MSIARIPGAESLAGESRAARRVILALLLIGAVTAQSTIFANLTILGVVPQLVLVVVVSLAFLEGDEAGALVGFSGGLLVDLLSPGAMIGLTAFVYTLLGYWVGRASYYAVPGSVVAPVFLVAVASLAGETVYAVASVLLGQRWIGIGDAVRIGGLVVVYNTLLTPLLFPLVRRIVQRLDRDQVVRL